MIFNSCHTLYSHENKVSVPTNDFQQITKNCQTESNMKRVENHIENLKNYYNIWQLLKNISQALKTTDILNWLGNPANGMRIWGHEAGISYKITGK